MSSNALSDTPSAAHPESLAIDDPSRVPAPLTYVNGQLHFDGVSIESMAVQHSTPFYCYSRGRIEQRIAQCQASFSGLDLRIHYAVKANSNLSVLRLMAEAGLGADIVSGGELTRALKAGIAPDRIIYSGVAKTDQELEQAIRAGVGQFNLESAEELTRIQGIAAELDLPVDAVLRVNPEVDAGTHAHITTGSKGNKFGIDYQLLDGLFQQSTALSHVKLRGLAMHIGSQICSLQPFSAAIQRMKSWVEQLRSAGHSIDRLDLGGGLGVDYGDGQQLSYEAYAEEIHRQFQGMGLQLQLEPGRSLVADAGILVTSVVSIKQADPRPFVMLDAGMNDLMRPALYQAQHRLLPTELNIGETIIGETRPVDVVGPICESTDSFLRAYPMPLPLPGALQVFTMAGAYGAVLSSCYNSRALVPELMVDNGQLRIVRRRWDIDQQLSLEE